MLERHIEDAIWKYPELIESELTCEGRQVVIGGIRVDVLYRDRHGYRLIVEVKRGTVARGDVAQLLDYEGYFVTPSDPRTRVMLVGTRVPQNFRAALDHHGFEWRELTAEHLKEFLLRKGDGGLATVFSEPASSPSISATGGAAGRHSVSPRKTKGLPALSAQTFAELSDVLRTRASQCSTNYMDLLLLENSDRPLSALIKAFHAVPHHAGSRDFQTVGRLKAHIKYRQEHDGWEFSSAGDWADPTVQLTGLSPRKFRSK